MCARDFEKPAGLARLESILALVYVEDLLSTAYADRLDAKAVVESILELYKETKNVSVLKRRWVRDLDK